MNKSTITQEIRALNLPELSGVIVVGGAYLELLGLRQAADIDLAVSGVNWNYLRDELAWPVYAKGKSPYMRSPDGRFDVWNGWYDRQHQRVIGFEELLRHSTRHEAGFLVPTIEYQIQLKRGDGRPKDITDIAMLEGLKP